MIRLAVVGDPIAHSRSPEIHHAFAAQFGLAIDYQKIRPERFEESVAALIASGARGFNCTVPFKGAAFERCDTLSPVAQATGAVNTVVIEGDVLHGENTDGDGLLRDLMHNLKWRLADARILLIGAGGAARGALPSLLSARPSCLHLTNRTLSRASELVSTRPDAGSVLSAVAGSGLSESYDLVINATSAGLHDVVPDLPASIISSETRAYDMVYRSNVTAFNHWATRHGARECVDGLGMLAEQAALSFSHWTGQLPETRDVMVQLRQGLR